jgi:hypothetical protein
MEIITKRLMGSNNLKKKNKENKITSLFLYLKAFFKKIILFYFFKLFFR